MQETTLTAPTHPPDETQRRGALLLRTLPILLIPFALALATAIALGVTVGDLPVPPRPAGAPQVFPLVPLVVLMVFAASLVILVRLGRPTLSALILIAVWTLLTTLGLLDSGVTSFNPALLLIPICVAGLLIDGTASVSLAALAALLVGGIGWMEAQGLTFGDGLLPAPARERAPLVAAGFWTGMFVTVAALTSLLAGSLQRALRQSRAQAAALTTLSAELEARVAAQTAALLAQGREAATLEERTRLAREIHDTLAQGLTGVVVQLGAAQRALAAAPDEAAPHLELAHRMARESLAEARRSVWNLRNPALERGDLADALRGLVAQPLRPETAARFELHGEPWPLPPDAEGALLRVAQEALVNVAKHARASEVTVRLRYLPDRATLTIHDNGIGFDPATLARPAATTGGFGLLGMQERMSALGGTLALRNAAGAVVVASVGRMV